MAAVALLSAGLRAQAQDDPVTAARRAIAVGDRLMSEGRVKSACLQYELAAGVAGEWWYAAYKRALCAIIEGDTLDARYLLGAVRLGGRDLYAPGLALARLLKEEGDEEAANEAYEAALSATRGALEPMVELADLLAAAGRGRDAELVLKRAAYYAPGNIAVRARLARLAEKLGHLFVAEEEYRFLAQQGTNPRRNLVELARFYSRNGHPEAAEDVLRILKNRATGEPRPDLPRPVFEPQGTP